jgi:hypothetical protein
LANDDTDGFGLVIEHDWTVFCESVACMNSQDI